MRNKRGGTPKHGSVPGDPYCYLARAVIARAFSDLRGKGRPDRRRRPGYVNEHAPTNRDARSSRVFLASALREGWVELGRIDERMIDAELAERCQAGGNSRPLSLSPEIDAAG